MSKERFDPLEVGKDQRVVKAYLNRYVKAGELLKAHGVTAALDAACGTGHGTSELSYHVRRVLGVDLSKEAMRICRERHSSNPRISFKRGDLERWVIPREYSGIVSLDTIEHLYQPQEFVRRIQANAKVVIVAWPLLVNKNPFHLSAITEDELREWFTGWKLLHCNYEPDDVPLYMFTAWSRPRG